MELFAALLCAVRPFSGSPFPRPLVFIELVTGFVVWSAFAFVELGCFVRPVRAFVLSELPLLVTRSSPHKKKNVTHRVPQDQTGEPRILQTMQQSARASAPCSPHPPSMEALQPTLPAAWNCVLHA